MRNKAMIYTFKNLTKLRYVPDNNLDFIWYLILCYFMSTMVLDINCFVFERDSLCLIVNKVMESVDNSKLVYK